MLENLPKMFGGRAAVRNDDNVTPLRDTEPTRPQRSTAAMDWPSGVYGPKPGAFYHTEGKAPPYHIRTKHDYEMEKAKTIFLAVVDEPADSRERIRKQVDLLLELYSHEPPTVEGAPV